ncbi:HlyD family secretion protein [Xanthomonas graminis]|nr:HlyD family secretion protein [Xanthomonas translucens]
MREMREMRDLAFFGLRLHRRRQVQRICLHVAPSRLRTCACAAATSISLRCRVEIRTPSHWLAACSACTRNRRIAAPRCRKVCESHAWNRCARTSSRVIDGTPDSPLACIFACEVHTEGTEMEGSLFRSEVLDAPSQAWLGTVRLATPVSTQAWTVAAMLIGASILAWLFAGHYTQRVHVSGLLVPRAGLISLTANTVGVVDHVAAAEGDRVVAGQILVSLSGEHTSKALGNTAAGVSTQLQRQALSLRQDIGDALTLQGKQAEDNRTQQTLLKDQLAQIDAQIAIEKKQMALVQDLVDKWSGLVAGGYIPRCRSNRNNRPCSPTNRSCVRCSNSTPVRASN